MMGNMIWNSEMLKKGCFDLVLLSKSRESSDKVTTIIWKKVQLPNFDWIVVEVFAWIKKKTEENIKNMFS